VGPQYLGQGLKLSRIKLGHEQSLALELGQGLKFLLCHLKFFGSVRGAAHCHVRHVAGLADAKLAVFINNLDVRVFRGHAGCLLRCGDYVRALLFIEMERSIFFAPLLSLAVRAVGQVSFKPAIDFRVRAFTVNTAIIGITTAYRLVFVIVEVIIGHGACLLF
jgi:hypothetical protein